MTKELNELGAGRGGGKPGFVQGTFHVPAGQIKEELLHRIPGLLVFEDGKR